MSDAADALRANIGLRLDVKTWGPAAGLFLVGIVSRLPFQSHILHHWDSVNFALALEHFDVRLDQPHAPGTFVFYIFLGRLLNAFLHDANASLVWVSILATGLAAAALFIIGSAWFGKRVGLVISLLMLSSPLVWFLGEVALSYLLEFFWVLLIVLVCFKMQSGDRWPLFVSALLIGMAGGIRPNTPVFMFPLWAVAVGLGLWQRRYSVRDVAAALGVMALGVALWAVPMVMMSGGPLAYWQIAQSWQSEHLEDAGSAEGVAVNTARFAMFVLYAGGAGLALVAWAFVREWRALKAALRHDWRSQVIALWIAPATAYYIFIHLRQAGHTFTIMPALFVIAGLATVTVGRRLERFVPNAWLVLAALVVACNSLFFWFGPSSLFGSTQLTFTPPTWATIREYDAFVASRVSAIRGEFRPEETAVIAGSRNFRLPDFYLRDYQATSLSYRLGEDAIVLPDGIHTLVLFDDTALAQLQDRSEFRSLPLPLGGSIRYATWNDNQQARLSLSAFKIENK